MTITPEAIRMPLAIATLTLALAITQKLLLKDGLVREGRWDERREHLGTGLAGSTFGLIGLGNVASALVELVRPLGVRLMAVDPFVSSESVPPDVEIVDLHTVLRNADVLFILCPLTPATRGLIGEQELNLMKDSAFLVNTARGPIVDSIALADALTHKRIRGAALDVFEPEPLPVDHPLLECENTILTPHSLCWTHECFRAMGVGACRAILDVAEGRVPSSVVNPEVLATEQFQIKLTRWRRA